MLGSARAALLGASGEISGGGGGGPFSVNAVRFDGANDHLDRGGNMTGSVDGNKFLFSCWFDLKGRDSLFSTLFSCVNQNWLIRRSSSNKWDCRAKNAAGSALFFLPSSTTYTTGTNPGWHHLLIAGDLAVGDPKAQMYADDVLDGSVIPTIDNINFDAGDWEVGRDVAGVGNRIDADIAELWFDQTFLDISVESNRRKFIDASGFPVDLGTDGSTPTGSVPLAYFNGDTDTWHTNEGDGGVFTEIGALTDADSSPSD